VGYTAVGNYADLSGVDYTRKLFNDRLDEILKWKKDFLKNVDKREYDTYLLQPDTVHFYNRPDSEYSSLFWQAASYPPNETLCGPLNVANLALSMASRMASWFDQMMALTDLSNASAGALLHGYKKQLRGFLTCMCSDFVVFVLFGVSFFFSLCCV